MSEDIFRSYARSFEQRREAEMSLQDFLTLCRDDPMAYATAHERLLAAIGEPRMVDTSIRTQLQKLRRALRAA